jgi:Putative restriction endonuclease
MNTKPLRPICLASGVPLLANGDRMSRADFHRRYEACPPDEKFELVGGTVYMASPLRYPHGTYHKTLSLVLGLYEAGTPGVEAADNVTTILGEESETHPDLALRILAECGGQSRVNDEEYLEGSPELIAEVAYSSRAIDMNQKRQDYQRAEVLEYLVLCIEGPELHWFHFPSGNQIQPNRAGVSRSLVFPGLWVHVQALLEQDGPRLIEVVQQGLASRPHAAFVRRLQAARRRSR